MVRWVPLGFDPRCVRNWDDGTVLYNALSGETHVLGPLAGMALRAITEAPASTDAIRALLTSELPEADPERLRAELDDLLTEMARLGVIAPEPA